MAEYSHLNEGLDASFADLQSTDCEYTTSEELQAIKPYDSTIEIVGYIDSIEASRTVGAKNHTLLKFFVSNNTGDRVQCIVWNNDLKRIESILRTNFVVHIDGAYAKPSLLSNFNKGTLNIELIVQSNTIVNILGMHKIENLDEQFIPDLICLEDVSKSNGFIRVEGYVKSNFLIISRQTVKSNDFGCGSITDGEFKLEVRITQMDNNHEFEKGDHVEICGNLQKTEIRLSFSLLDDLYPFYLCAANPLHLQVKSLEMVKLIDHEKMTLSKLLKGCKCIVLQNEDTKSNGTPAQKRARQN